ncbi:MAG: prolyl oligopeptidase family serine peptidase [Candidatus Acidiferrales bacterium]
MRGKILPILSAAIALACFAAMAIAASDAKPQPDGSKFAWAPADVVFQEHAGEFRISPDGKWTVWVRDAGDKEKNEQASNLYLSSLTDDKVVPLTRGSNSVSNPRWSPSGDSIGFISNRAPQPKPGDGVASDQLWLLNAAGGEPWVATHFARNIEQFEWLDDDTILFSAEEAPSLREREEKTSKDDARVVDDAAHKPPVRLFKLSLKNGRITRLTDNADWILFFAVSRDKKKAVAVARRELSYAWDQKIPPATYLIDLATGERTEIFKNGKNQPDSIAWAPDNAGFYVAAPYSDDPRFLTASVERVYYYDLASKITSEVNLDWDRGIFRDEVEPTEDGFIALLADGVHTKAARYTRQGSSWTRAEITGEHPANYFNFALGDDGQTLIYNYSTASTPTQWYRARLEGAQITLPVQLTHLNPSFDAKLKAGAIAKTQVINWKGANDDNVEGILYYPENYQAGKSYPLIVATHGGPALADHDAWEERWFYAPNLYTQRGAFVLKTNYHGSAGYGLKWEESICCGKIYDQEIPDIEKGVDHLIAQGLVDPEKIGALGWSYGSILSIQLTVANPDRYKAAAVGAGDVEWISDWANVDFGEAYDDYYFGKTPLQDPELYIRKSPVFKMDRVKTPTLIFFGTNDRQVPTEEGWTHYRALYVAGKAPVKFILFPGETHHFDKLTHQLRKLDEETAWFDKYLFKTAAPENEAFKTGSPLDLAVQRASFRKVGALYGIEVMRVQVLNGQDAAKPAAQKTLLIPETVKHGALQIGRFEVTRAQFASFDPSYRFADGTGNYPANGITFEQAKAYCAWLSTILGNNIFRLPNENEVGDLYRARSGENTLDYWAGYPLNPEDAAKLEQKVWNDLSGDAPLLREVGSFAPDSDDDREPIFDLGGNVAEWVVAADGTGKTLGGSADRPADPEARYRLADPKYTGFRVLLDAARSN